MDPHRLEQLRSIAFHQRVAEIARERPRVLQAARERVDGWIVRGGAHPEWARRWAEVLAAPDDQLWDAVLADDDAGNGLRQSSPFAGVLEPQERWRIFADVGAAARE